MKLAPLEIKEEPYAWWREVSLALDCLFNALAAGWHHETLSSRAWRAFVNGKPMRWARWAIDVLFVWQARDMKHCHRHYLKERWRAQEVGKQRIGDEPI